jgi:NADH-quinone oxidoreductase subunit D
MYSWRDREAVMNLLEDITGNRVNYSLNVLGGVKCDVSPAQADKIQRSVNELEERTRHYMGIVTTDVSFLRRTRDIGYMNLAEAKHLGVVGPTARASGLACDIRTEAPYGAYPDFPIQQILATGGDLAARFVVRLNELLEAFRSIREILAKLPAGELSVKFPRRIPAGEVISRVEAPRGELFYFIKSNGGDKPDRVKIRTPSICNFASVIKLATGHQLADVPMLLAGIDPCFSCNDR